MLLTSTNPIKIQVVYNFLSKFFPNIIFSTIDGNRANMPAQPMDEQIFECCMIRMQGEKSPIISIENGIRTTENGYEDVCCMIFQDNKMGAKYFSFGIPIDPVLVKLYLEFFDPKTTTFGRFLSYYFGVDPANWMADSRFGGVDRRDQIKNVLEKWLIDYYTDTFTDFPKKGVTFKSMDTILENPGLNTVLFDHLTGLFQRNYQMDYIAGIDSRGYIYGSVLADRLGCGFIMVRKAKKVPHTTEQKVVSDSYDTEYSSDSLGILERPEYVGKKVVIIDDLIATGGTMKSSQRLLEKVGMNVVGTFTVLDVGLDHGIQGHLTLFRERSTHVKYQIPELSLLPIRMDKQKKTDESFLVNNWRCIWQERVKIIASDSNRELANRISTILDYPIANATIGKFNNGETRVEIKENIRNCKIWVIASTRTGHINDDLMEVLLILDACSRANVEDISIIMPYFPYARSDKKDQPRVPISSKVVADMIEKFKPVNVVSIDLHAGQLQGFIDKGFHNLYIVKYMAQELHDRYLRYYPKSEWASRFVLVSPDAGSIKRIEAYAKLLGIQYIILHKQRDYSQPGTVVNSIIVGDPDKYQGRVAIIIDDIGDTMGTMCSAVRELKSHGIDQTIVALTHGVFSGPAISRLNETPEITEIIVTNTLPQSDNQAKCPKLRVLDCSQLLARTIDAITSGASVSQLFQ